MIHAVAADLVSRADSERFRAIMAGPASARGPLFAVHAANIEIARAPWASREPLIAQMRLQFWADLADALAQGKPPMAHELTPALVATIAPQDAGLLARIVQARHADIETAPFADEAALLTYLDETGGNLIWLSARVLGARAELEPALRGLGFAFALANYLRAIPVLEARGRIPLPDGRKSTVAHLARVGLGRLHAARLERGLVPRDIRASLYPTWVTGPILTLAAREPERVAQGRLDLSEAGKRLRLIYAVTSGRW